MTNTDVCFLFRTVMCVTISTFGFWSTSAATGVDLGFVSLPVSVSRPACHT